MNCFRSCRPADRFDLILPKVRASAFAALSSGQAGAAGTITVVSDVRGVTIASNGPVEQTFVATDSLLTNFAFQFASSISGQTNGTVTFSLISGAGTTGTTITSQTTALSGLCITTTWFFHTASYRMHLWMTIQICALLSLLIFMVGILDNPFRGRVSVSSESFELVRTHLIRKPIPGELQSGSSSSDDNGHHE